MQPRQSFSPAARSSTALQDKSRRRGWPASLVLAVLLYACVGALGYLLVVGWGMAQQGGSVGASGLPGALGYPLTLAPAQLSLAQGALSGVCVVLAFAACLFFARRVGAQRHSVGDGLPPALAAAASVTAQGTAPLPALAQAAPPAPSDATPAPPAAPQQPAPDASDAPDTSLAPSAAAVATVARHATPLASATPTFDANVFISHSSGDKAFGEKLEQRLKAALGADKVFYDADGGLRGGDDWLTRLQYEIGTRNVFVLILSPQAFASPWVLKELRYALRRAVSVAGMVIVPVLHEPTDVWPFLSEYQFVDFVSPTEAESLTPDEKFEQGFADLLYAVRLGRSRIDELERMRQIRQGPPFDLDELPVPDRFVGRAEDVQWTLDQLAPEDDTVPAGGLASIAATNGLGGIGKSALAGQVARILRATNRFPGGIAVVACNNLTDPVTVLRRALARFDEQRAEPQENELRALRDLAKQVFATRHALVILDNVEPDWPVEEVVRTLRTAGASVLLTSRLRLAGNVVPAEASRMLEILSPGEAVDLFAEYYGRGTKQDLTFPEQEQVGRIVQALGYHTLAVTLAAARAKGRDLAVVAQEYEDDPRLGVNLKDGTQAVRVMLESSLEAVAKLAPAAPRLFALLAAFATREMGRNAALAVAEAMELTDPRASLEALTDLRLVDAGPNVALPEDADRERLRLHPLVRTFAEEQLESWSADDRQQARATVAAWYGEYANAASNRALATDEDNIVGALREVQGYAGELDADRLIARLCDGMRAFWRDAGRTRAGLEFLQWGIAAANRVAEATQDRADRLRLANIAVYYGDILRATGKVERAEQAYKADLSVRRDITDRQGEGVALGRLGQVARARGQLEQAQDYFERSLAIAEEVGYRPGEGTVLNNLGQVARARGQLEQAQDYFERSLAIAEEVGDRQGEGTVLSNLGDVARARGQLEQAQDYYERSLAIAQEVGDRPGEGVTLNNLGELAQDRGQLEQAQDYYERSLTIARETEYAVLERAASGNLAAVMAKLQAGGQS